MSPLPKPPAPVRSLRPALAVLASLAFAAGSFSEAAPAAAEDSSPFAIRRHDVRGIILQVWSLSVSGCEDAAKDLLILSSEGGPPTQRRFATFLPCGSALRPGDPRIRVHPIPPAAVAVDVARLPGRTGPQLLSVSATGLRIEALEGDPAVREIAIPGGLPLPPRPWEIGRLPMVEAWNDDGRPAALLPTPTGAWLVDLASEPGAPPRRIEMPVYASYETSMPDLPETVWKWMVQEVHWPTLSRADDDGDGRRDLFALSRYGIWIYHAGPAGLPSSPSRKLDFVPFDEKAERRFETSIHNYFTRDLDGDTRADLVINLIQGGLMEGRSTTRIHLNRGAGASLAGRPDAVLEAHGGIAGVDFVDLEGDGRLELLETNFEFGVLQLVRLLVSRRAETKVRILALDPASPGGVRTLFEDELALTLDFKESRFAGILPGMGDWNGDGLLDLFVTRGDQSIGFRLGSRTPGKPRFGPVTGQQTVPLVAGASRVADLDGDGLDEIIAFTSTDPDQPLVVLENLGRLPGSPSSLRPR